MSAEAEPIRTLTLTHYSSGVPRLIISNRAAGGTGRDGTSLELVYTPRVPNIKINEGVFIESDPGQAPQRTIGRSG